MQHLVRAVIPCNTYTGAQIFFFSLSRARSALSRDLGRLPSERSHLSRGTVHLAPVLIEYWSLVNLGVFLVDCSLAGRVAPFRILLI